MRRAGGGNAVGLIAWRRQYYQRRRCSGISAAAAAAAAAAEAATVLYCIIHLRRCAASQMTRSLISVVTGHLAPDICPLEIAIANQCHITCATTIADIYLMVRV